MVYMVGITKTNFGRIDPSHLSVDLHFHNARVVTSDPYDNCPERSGGRYMSMQSEKNGCLSVCPAESCDIQPIKFN